MIIFGADIEIVAGSHVVRVLAAHQRVALVVGAGIAIVAIQREPGLAFAVSALVSQRAHAAVIARHVVVQVLAALHRVTYVGRADIAVVARRQSTTLADALHALLSLGAGVAVIARPGDVCEHAPLALLAFILGAGVAVVACQQHTGLAFAG